MQIGLQSYSEKTKCLIWDQRSLTKTKVICSTTGKIMSKFQLRASIGTRQVGMRVAKHAYVSLFSASAKTAAQTACSRWPGPLPSQVRKSQKSSCRAGMRNIFNTCQKNHFIRTWGLAIQILWKWPNPVIWEKFEPVDPEEVDEVLVVVAQPLCSVPWAKASQERVQWWLMALWG